MHNVECVYVHCEAIQRVIQVYCARQVEETLDVQKVHDTVWREVLWLKLWDMDVKGKTRCVILKMYEAPRSAVLL